MKRLLAVLAFSVSIVSANAESWEKIIHSNDNATLFVDMESISSKDEDGYHRAVFKGVYYDNNEPPKNKLEEVHMVIQFDCSSEPIRGRILSITYDEDQQYFSKIGNIQEFKDIQPNTTGMFMVYKICF